MAGDEEGGASKIEGNAGSGALLNQDLPELFRQIRNRTPARLLAGRSGAAYRTSTQLDLREAHAAARDAVRAEFDLSKSFAGDSGSEFVRRWNLFEVRTQAASKDEFILRPDLGRRFHADSAKEIKRRCPTGIDLQIAIGDGLSVTAVSVQVPRLLPLLSNGAKTRGWSVGQPFAIRYCRVGVLNDIGDLLAPKVAVLLIGERPGLATAESLSAYMAYCPKAADTDANRNLISNIHARGVIPEQAAVRILNLADAMLKTRSSGFLLRESLPQLL